MKTTVDMNWLKEKIDNAPNPCETCEDKATSYSMGFQDGFFTGKETAMTKTGQERPTCKSCIYYEPYTEQFTNKPRGDGYCKLPRMTTDGYVCINCDDDWFCADMRGKEE